MPFHLFFLHCSFISLIYLLFLSSPFYLSYRCTAFLKHLECAKPEHLKILNEVLGRLTLSLDYVANNVSRDEMIFHACCTLQGKWNDLININSIQSSLLVLLLQLHLLLLLLSLFFSSPLFFLPFNWSFLYVLYSPLV